MRSEIFILAIAALATAQLNFEGNPLTDNTEYTAEESQTSKISSTQELSKSARSQKLFSPAGGKGDVDGGETTNREKSENAEKGNGQYARHFQSPVYAQPQPQTAVNPTNLALDTFLHSKTPEESRMSLDYYLRSQLPPAETAQTAAQQPLYSSSGKIERNGQLVELHLPQRQQTQLQTSHAVQQQRYVQIPQQVVQQQQRYLQATGQNVGQEIPAQQNLPTIVANNQPFVNLAPSEQVAQPTSIPLPQSFVHRRTDFLAPMGWRQRTRRIRGPQFPMVQSRIGPGYYKGPIPAPLKRKAPVEVIYTRPPGFHSGPPPLSNPPVPYEDASTWFPDADHPPPAKDIYYSQLYAQSYDPHYYNYIAKTGKIKPWLYGKLDKHHEESGIWAELLGSFKKHGLKNMMSPGFLLGMTIPTAIALMFTAFVHKRSLGRTDSREFSQESVVDEYLERIRKAVECYERKNRNPREPGPSDGC